VCINTFALVGATPPVSVHSLQVTNGASLYFNGGPSGAKIAIATLFYNDAYVELESSYALDAGAINNPGGIDVVAGDSTIASPSFSNTGTLAAVDGTVQLLDAPRQLRSGVLSGGTWDAYGGKFVLPQDIAAIAGGTVAISQSAAITDAAGNDALSALSSIGSAGTLVLDDQAVLAVAGSLVSQGHIELGSYSGGAGTLSIAGSYTQESGAAASLSQGTLSAKAVAVGAGSRLEGGGTVIGPVTNSGTVAPLSQLFITGDYTQTAAGTLSDYFRTSLAVSGKATLAGALTLLINDRCPPPVGSQFTAVTYGSRSGTFATHSTGFGLRYGAHALTVTYQG
jgi:hypothetical protein